MPSSSGSNNLNLQTHLLISNFLESNLYLNSLNSFKLESKDVLGKEEVKLNSNLPDLRFIIEEFLIKLNLEEEDKNKNNKENKNQINNNSINSLEESLNNLNLNSKLPTKVNHTLRESTNFLSIRSGLFPKRYFDTLEGRFKRYSCFDLHLFLHYYWTNESTSTVNRINVYSVHQWIRL